MSTSGLEPKVRRFGVRVENEAGYFPILNIGPSADGGLIITPRAVPASGWSLARATPSPAFGRADFVPLMPDVTYLAAGDKPKLHYHRSGEVTLKAQALKARNVRVKLTPVEAIEAQQVLYFFQAAPTELTPAKERPDDGYAVSHVGPPAGVSVVATMHSFARNPYVADEFLSRRSWSIVRGDQAYFALDLRSFGIDSFMSLVPKFHDFVSPEVATTQLMGLCGTYAQKSPYVYLLSEDGAPTPRILHDSEIPKFPHDSTQRTMDRRRVTRGLDGRADYGDFI